jgi:hypothetical protein
MAQTDQIAVTISEGDLADIQGALGTLQAKLMPHLKTLTPQERIELPKMGDKTVAFVTKALEYGQAHAELVPAFLDVPAMAVDVKAVQQLRNFTQVLTPLSDALNDSLMLSGSEAYQGALVFYANVKTAARVRVPKAQSVYDDLASRFPGATAKKATTAKVTNA